MSSNEQKDSAPKNQELDDLLDNALQDFDANTVRVPVGTGNGPKADGELPENAELFNEDFFVNQARLLGDRLNSAFGDDQQHLSADQMALGFQKMAEAAAMALQGETTDQDDGQKYADSISEALKGLQGGVENLQAPVSETDVASMFSGLGLGAGEDADGNPFLPFMQGMMQSLLSAEILLPSIKELLEKYPSYLAENAEKLSPEDKERFEKQHDLFNVICKDLETEKPDDTAEVKQDRFKRVLDNMQKLHEYGQPPEEIVGDVGAAGIPGFDAAAPNPNAQCPMM